MNPPYPSASLYVGDLASDISESVLFDVFSQVAQVSHIRVCRDAVSRKRSLGYAYVNYYNSADAEKALDTLNNTLLKGKPCRIMWSQRDPSLRKSGVGNIFVKNLDKSIDHKALYDIFSKFGNILSCKVSLDSNNNSKGFGFVHFETQESANKAIQEINQQPIKGKEVFVGPFIPRKERNMIEDKFTNVFVKNLDETVNEEKLREMFGKYGTITSAYVSYSQDKKSKCFGFVNFDNHLQAVAAIEGLNQTTPNEGGKQLFVGKAQKKSDRIAELRQKYEHRKESHGVNVFVKNIDSETDEEKLKEEFAPFGNIVSVKIMKDDKGKNRGYGFICFKTKDEAHKTIYEFRKKNSAGVPIYVALAHRKDSRDRHQRNSRRGGAGGAGGHYQATNRTQRQGPGRNFRRGYSRGGGGGSGGQRHGQDRKGTKVEADQTKISTNQQQDTKSQINEIATQLHALITVMEPQLAGKITGMLLARYPVPEELGHFVNDQAALKEKVDEAIQVLNQAQKPTDSVEEETTTTTPVEEPTTTSVEEPTTPVEEKPVEN